MDLDTFRHLARKAYRKEYVAKTPIGLREKVFLYPAAGMLTGGLWVAGGTLAAMMFGFAIAAPVFAAALVTVAAALPLMHFGSALADRRAEYALERDINNGVLLAHFQQNMLPQPRMETAESKLIVLSAKESFNKSETAPILVPLPSVSAPALQPAAA